MKKIVLSLTILSTLTACNQAQPFRPQLAQQNMRFNAASASAHNPDFARKLRSPKSYRVNDASATSICGGKNTMQEVNDYQGNLGQPADFVKKHQGAVGALARGNKNSRKFCSGTLIGTNLFLTASHCIDRSVTKDKYAVFNYETKAGSKDLLEQDHYKVTEVVEDGVYGRGLDYAILKLEGAPGEKYGFTGVKAYMPKNEHLLTIIQHPRGLPKKIESGPNKGSAGKYMKYADLDTEPGSSGSGVLDKDGYLVGVHTNGGCYSGGGANKGVKMTEILKLSDVIKDLNQAGRSRAFARFNTRRVRR